MEGVFGRGDPVRGFKVPPNPKCPECGLDTVVYEVIDDIHDDRCYHCTADGCNYRRVSEGSDA